MYFPHAFRKSFLPSSQAAIASVATATLGTTTGYVIPVTSATGIVVGQNVIGAGIPAGAIVSIISSLNITISLPITAAIASGATIVFGNGAATTTTTAPLNAPNVLQFGTTAASTAGIVPGMTVTVSGVPAGTVVVSVSGGFVTLSNSVTATITTTTTVAFGASGVSILTSGSTGTLTAGQVGFFSPDGVAVQAASAKPFIIAQGSYFNSDKISPALGGYKESVKTKMINPKYISRVIKITAKSARQMIVQVPVIANTGLTCDTTYRLRVDAKGSPALRFLSHNMYRTLDSYTGCCSTVDPTLLKDPVPTLLNWADQINLSPIFNTMVQARVYKLSTTQAATSIATAATTTSVKLNAASTTGIAIGQKAVGTGIPASAFVTALTTNTDITITYPTQAVAPTISGTVSVKYYNDLYSGALSTYGYTATAAGGSATVPTYLPATNTESGVGGSLVTSGGVATGANILPNLAGTSLGAIVYLPLADAASFTVDAHIELYAAYIETKFGICTFTPTDKYDLEPLLLYTSIVDESGDPCVSAVFTGSNSATGTNTSANDATIVQTAVQASGIGETILRDFILSDRYLQNAYPDSSRVESLRMREIEQNPALSNISRTSLYDQVMVLHSVPRFNNPTATFDNDQYLLVFSVPTGTSTTGLTNYLVSAVTAAGGTIPTNTAGGTFEQY
jgi:hypothetical protein